MKRLALSGLGFTALALASVVAACVPHAQSNRWVLVAAVAALAAGGLAALFRSTNPDVFDD